MEELILLGATNDLRFSYHRRRKIDELVENTGAWASWWSYHIQPTYFYRKFNDFINRGKSFKLLWYEKGSIFWESNVIDFKHVDISPWPEHTFPEWRNRNRIDGTTTKDQQFRLWFLIDGNKNVNEGGLRTTAPLEE